MSKKILVICVILLLFYGLIALLISSVHIIKSLFFSGADITFLTISNLICATLYLTASLGFYKKNWVAPASLYMVVALLIVTYLTMIYYTTIGEEYEYDLLVFYLIKVMCTIVIAGIAWYQISRIKLISYSNNQNY